MPRTIIYTIRGEGTTDRATCSDRIPDATTEAHTIEYAQDLSELMDAIIGGVIEFCQYVANVAYTVTAAAPFSDNEEIAVFECICADGTETVITLPTINEANVSADRALIGTEIDDIRTAILSGIGGTSPCGVGGSDIVAIKADYAAYRSSGKSKT